MSFNSLINKLDRVSWLFICINILVFFTLLIYSNSFTGGLVMDDANVIKPKLTQFWEQPELHLRLGKQRMVADYTFAFNYLIHGTETTGYHVVNFLIHVCNGILVLILVLLLMQTPALKKSRLYTYRRILALSSALFFVCHPLQTMAVTYMTQRYTSLASLFYLLTVIIYLITRSLVADRARSRLIYWSKLYGLIALGVSLFLLGLHTKEIVATLPMLLVLVEWLLYRRGQIPWKTVFLSQVALGLVFLLAQQLYPLTWIFSHQENSIGEIVTPQNYLLTQPRVFLKYLQKILLPINLIADYYFPISTSIFDIRVWIGLAVWVSLWAGVFVLRHRQPLIALGIAWFLVTPLVDSSFIPIVDVINEYRLYLPLVGVALAVNGFLWYFWAPKSEMAVLVVITSLYIGFGLLTFNRNFVYTNDLTFWGDVIKKSPQKARGFVNYAVGLHSRGQAKEALAYYQQALKIDPNRLTALSNIGVLYTQAGRFDTAQEYFSKTLAVDPEYIDAINGLGVVYMNTGEFQKAEAAFTQVVKLDPSNNSAQENLQILQAKRTENK